MKHTTKFKVLSKEKQIQQIIKEEIKNVLQEVWTDEEHESPTQAEIEMDELRRVLERERASRAAQRQGKSTAEHSGVVQPTLIDTSSGREEEIEPGDFYAGGVANIAKDVANRIAKLRNAAIETRRMPGESGPKTGRWGAYEEAHPQAYDPIALRGELFDVDPSQGLDPNRSFLFPQGRKALGGDEGELEPYDRWSTRREMMWGDEWGKPRSPHPGQEDPSWDRLGHGDGDPPPPPEWYEIEPQNIFLTDVPSTKRRESNRRMPRQELEKIPGMPSGKGHIMPYKEKSPLQERAYRREELYHGPATNEAPELILELALGTGPPSISRLIERFRKHIFDALEAPAFRSRQLAEKNAALVARKIKKIDPDVFKDYVMPHLEGNPRVAEEYRRERVRSLQSKRVQARDRKFDARMAKIKAMPEGPEKLAAQQRWVRGYPSSHGRFGGSTERAEIRAKHFPDHPRINMQERPYKTQVDRFAAIDRSHPDVQHLRRGDMDIYGRIGTGEYPTKGRGAAAAPMKFSKMEKPRQLELSHTATNQYLDTPRYDPGRVIPRRSIMYPPVDPADHPRARRLKFPKILKKAGPLGMLASAGLSLLDPDPAAALVGSFNPVESGPVASGDLPAKYIMKRQREKEVDPYRKWLSGLDRHKLAGHEFAGEIPMTHAEVERAYDPMAEFYEESPLREQISKKNEKTFKKLIKEYTKK